MYNTTAMQHYLVNFTKILDLPLRLVGPWIGQNFNMIT